MQSTTMVHGIFLGKNPDELPQGFESSDYNDVSWKTLNVPANSIMMLCDIRIKK